MLFRSKGKIEELLRSLTDNVLDGDEDEEGQPDEEDLICGWKREELLKEAVLILGKSHPPTIASSARKINEPSRQTPRSSAHNGSLRAPTRRHQRAIG